MSSALRDDNSRVALIAQNVLGTAPIYITGSNLSMSNPLHVAIMDGSGNQITSFGSPTNYSLETGGNLAGIKTQTDKLTFANTRLLVDAAITVDNLTVSQNIAQWGGVNTSLGQKVMASSLPVSLASDQPALPISGTVTANTGLAQPLTDTQLRATPVPVSGSVGTSLNGVNVGQTTSNSTAVQFQAGSIAATNGVIVQALSTNTASVFIGGSGVTTSTGFELQAGQATPFTVTNVNLLYVIGTNNTDKICWNVL